MDYDGIEVVHHSIAGVDVKILLDEMGSLDPHECAVVKLGGEDHIAISEQCYVGWLNDLDRPYVLFFGYDLDVTVMTDDDMISAVLS